MSSTSTPLIKYITDEVSLNECSKQISTFKELYFSGFPDINEREDFEVIIQRIISKPSNLDPNTFIILATDIVTGKVLGGMIGDWYDHCKAIHLTYIVVDPSNRAKGIGKILMEKGLTDIKEIIRKNTGIELKYVFFESNIPWKTSLDSFVPNTRLQIFSSMGAKWIDIDYVQPALDKNKKRVNNLFLLAYPGPEYSTEKIPCEYIISFLYDLYRGLGIEHPDNDPDFMKMTKDLENRQNKNCLLREIPLQESGKYQFRKCSIAFHFVEENVSIKNTTNKADCKYFHSYETDLLNFSFQKETPFETHLLAPARTNRINIGFPEEYCYVSEGRSETRHSERTSVPANVAISQTYFRKAGIKVWHIIITPGEDSYFTEFDLIRLISFFGSKQENCGVKEDVKFASSERDNLKLENLISEITGMKTGPLLFSGTGLVEIDSSETFKGNAKPEFSWQQFYGYLTQLDHRNNSLQSIVKKEDINEEVFGFLKITCGIILGIFDFERMGIEEIDDTLNPIEASESYYTVLNRGSLVCIGHKEEMLSTVYTTIGINPYLLIPSTVLCYDDFILGNVILILDQVLNDVNRSGKSDHSVMVEERRKAQHKLNNLPLNNLFHYPTERSIYSTGTSQRQFDLRELDINKKIKELTDIIEAKSTYIDIRSKAMISLVLIVFSCVGLYSTFETILKSPFITWVVLIIFSIPVSVFVYRKSMSQK